MNIVFDVRARYKSITNLFNTYQLEKKIWNLCDYILSIIVSLFIFLDTIEIV